MTRIYAEHNPLVGRCYLRVKDHATGSVETCAAISALVWALEGYLHNATGIKIRTERVDSADVTIEYWGDQMAVGAYLTTIIGLLQIAKQYPDYLDMDYVEAKN